MTFPDWWEWEIELTPHVQKRMADRRFTEVDLRRMLEHATGFQPEPRLGRFIIHARCQGRAWQVVVEPDEVEHLLVVVTAFSPGP